MGFFGFSFSWRRALGISAAQARLSRRIGIPLTQAGRERKVGRAVMGSVGVLPLLIGGSRRGAVFGCLGSLVRLAVLVGLIAVSVTVYRRYTSRAKQVGDPAKPAVAAPAKPQPVEPTFEDILKQQPQH